jgi:Calx-beta domain/Bacterial Ig domain
MRAFRTFFSVMLAAFTLAVAADLKAQILPDTNGPVVTVIASDNSATEGADSSVFTISRTGDTNGSLLVYFAASGTAQSGLDYKDLGTSILIPPGARAVRLEVVPVDDTLVETNETVVLHLTQSPLANAGSFYKIGTPAEAVVVIHDNDAPIETNHPPVVRIVNPTNHSVFLPPANISIFAEASDLDGTVQTVEFFAGSISLGVVTNNPLVMSPINPWHVFWTNVPSGSYGLRAIATDDKGARGESPLVSIIVRSEITNIAQPLVTIVATDPDAREIPPVPPGQERPQLYDPAVFTFTRTGDTGFPLTVYYRLGGTAQNGVDYEKLPGSITIPAGELSAAVYVSPIDDLLPEGDESVEISLILPPCAAVIPPPQGCYGAGVPSHALAIIHDDDLPPPTNRPPFVKLISPPNGAEFRAPANIFIQASAGDADGFVKSVAFYSGTNQIGQTDLSSNQLAVLGPNLVYGFVWSNVSVGTYEVTAIATDDQGASSVSIPVHITVAGTNVPPPPETNGLPVVTIFARDAYAAEGTNAADPNTATFVVTRFGNTNTTVIVYYSVSGSASNGVDYKEISGSVTIPAGERSARITITPLDDNLPEPTETIVLELHQPPFDFAATYKIGFPARAAAFIVDNDRLPPPTCQLPDGLFHLCLPGTNGWPYRLDCSTDMVSWITICTNKVVDGAIHFVEPDSGNTPQRFYRILPEISAPGE